MIVFVFAFIFLAILIRVAEILILYFREKMSNRRFEKIIIPALKKRGIIESINENEFKISEFGASVFAKLASNDFSLILKFIRGDRKIFEILYDSGKTKLEVVNGEKEKNSGKA